MDRQVKVSAVRRVTRLSARLPGRWDRRARELGKFVLNYRGARRTAARTVLYGVLRRYSTMLAAPYGRGTILVDSADDEVGRNAFIRGDYERIYMKAALECLKEHGIEPGPVFVDVGANIGTSTLDALLEFGFQEAVCFEPDPRNFRLLLANLLLNGLEDRTDAHALAASDADGTALLQQAGANFGDSRLAAGNAGEGLPVETLTLDSAVERGLVDLERTGLVWVDAQGHDGKILAGAARLAGAGIPVVVEYWPKGLAEQGCLELFEQVVAGRFTTVVDLRLSCEAGPGSGSMPATGVGGLRERYLGAEFTDLLLL